MNLCREYLRSVSQPLCTADSLDQLLTNAADSPISPDSSCSTESSENSLMLHYFYGYKKREIARMTGASYEAVKSRIRQGLRKLRKEISFS